MKRNLYLICILATLLVLSCFKPKFTAKETAIEFLVAIENGDWKVAKSFATEDAQSELDMMESLGNEPKRRRPVVKRVDEMHDHATAYYYYEGDEDQERELDMVSTEGKGWQVEFSKSEHGMADLSEGLEEAMESLEDEDDSYAQQDYDDYYDLEGDIDYNLDVEMNFRIRYGLVEGSYIYSKVGKPLALLGTLNTGSGTLDLQEYNELGEVTGTFDGKLTPSGNFEGTWQKEYGSEKLSFSLDKNGETSDRYHTDISENNVEVVISNELLSNIWATVQVEDLLVRDEPHLEGDAVARLDEGERVKLTGNYSFHYDDVELRGVAYSALWYEVAVDTEDEFGWVYGGGIEIDPIQ